MANMFKDFENNIKLHMNEIINLQTEFLAMELMNEMVKDQFKMSSKKVLAENEFHVSEENLDTFYEKRGHGVSSRILEESDSFLMSDDDFEIYLKLYTAENCKRGLTDEKGYYTEETNTFNKLSHLKDRIVLYAVELLPDIPEKETLRNAVTPGNRFHYNTWEKVFDLFMKIR